MITLNDEPAAWYEGMTVADLLATVRSGSDYAVVRVNEHYVTQPNFASFRIPDQAVVYLIPMIAGG